VLGAILLEKEKEADGEEKNTTLIALKHKNFEDLGT
jgi:hypothetical protein